MVAGTYVFALVILVGISMNYATTEWPEQCEGKYYCRKGPKPSSYPNESSIDLILKRDMFTPTLVPRGGMEDRSANPIKEEDVANCGYKNYSFVEPIYAIKDENDIVWYVPATSNFSVNVETYECTNPGRVTYSSESGLLGGELQKHKVVCKEQKLALKFPVLSQDLSKLETELKSPKGGLPISCSAKILKRN